MILAMGDMGPLNDCVSRILSYLYFHLTGTIFGYLGSYMLEISPGYDYCASDNGYLYLSICPLQGALVMIVPPGIILLLMHLLKSLIK